MVRTSFLFCVYIFFRPLNKVVVKVRSLAYRIMFNIREDEAMWMDKCVKEKGFQSSCLLFPFSSETKKQKSYESQTGKAIHHHLNAKVIFAFLPPMYVLL